MPREPSPTAEPQFGLHPAGLQAGLIPKEELLTYQGNKATACVCARTPGAGLLGVAGPDQAQQLELKLSIIF